MKKLLFILMVLFATTVSAQTYFNVHTTQTGVWDGESWIYDNPQNSNLVITMKGKSVFIDDNAHSTYYCYDYKGDDSWLAIDEKNRKCLLLLISTTKGMCLTIMYNDVLIRYYYR